MASLSFSDVWLPLIYLYGVGGIIFFIGMYIIKRTGAIDLSLKRHRKWWRLMIFGYFYFLFLHTFFTILGLNT